MRRKIIIPFFIILSIALFIPHLSFAELQPVEKEEFVKAKIYYCGWNILTRTRLMPDMVRKNPEIETTIYDTGDISCIIRLLDLSKLKKSEGVGDTRLVVDLYEANGSMVSYYASRDRLYSADSSLSREISEYFRMIFDFFKTAGSSVIPEVDYDWYVMSWDSNWKLPKLEAKDYDKQLIDRCISDYKHTAPSAEIEFKQAYVSKDNKIWYFMFDGVNVRDLVVVYFYDVKGKEFRGKFHIPMA